MYGVMAFVDARKLKKNQKSFFLHYLCIIRIVKQETLVFRYIMSFIKT